MKKHGLQLYRRNITRSSHAFRLATGLPATFLAPRSRRHATRHRRLLLFRERVMGVYFDFSTFSGDMLRSPMSFQDASMMLRRH